VSNVKSKQRQSHTPEQAQGTDMPGMADPLEVQQLADPLTDPLVSSVQFDGPNAGDYVACVPRLAPGGESYGECLDRRSQAREQGRVDVVEQARQRLEEELADRSELINAYQIVTNEDARSSRDAYREAIASGDSDAMEAAAETYADDLNDMLADLGEILAESEVGAVAAYGDFLSESRGFINNVNELVHARAERGVGGLDQADPNAGTTRGVGRGHDG
jgi:hypothetical protein